MRIEAGTECVVFSPTEEFEKVISIVDRNAAKQ
jgi:hypothetical protein